MNKLGRYKVPSTWKHVCIVCGEDIRWQGNGYAHYCRKCRRKVYNNYIPVKMRVATNGDT